MLVITLTEAIAIGFIVFALLGYLCLWVGSKFTRKHKDNA